MKLFENSKKVKKTLTEANDSGKTKKEYDALVASINNLNSMKAKKITDVINSASSELKKFEILRTSLAQDLMNAPEGDSEITSEILRKLSRNEDRILWEMDNESELLAKIARDYKKNYSRIAADIETLLKKSTRN